MSQGMVRVHLIASVTDGVPDTGPFNMMIVAIPPYMLCELGITISSALATTSLREEAQARVDVQAAD